MLLHSPHSPRPPIYTLSLHDALPISALAETAQPEDEAHEREEHDGHDRDHRVLRARDRKSTRLNSSHQIISYAVFCLKKKKKQLNKIYHTEELIIRTQKKHVHTSTKL